MYFYTISGGCYSDYDYTIVCHEKKFTNKEFAKMYNAAIEKLGGKTHFSDDVAEKLVELFNFEIVKDEFEIHVDYGYYEPCDLNDISEDECFYNNGK